MTPGRVTYCAHARSLRPRTDYGRFARVLACAGRAEAAARVLAAGEALHEEMGARPMAWLQRGNDEALDLVRTRLDDAAVAEAFERGRRLTVDEAVELALHELGHA